jgi:hypothetical protein
MDIDIVIAKAESLLEQARSYKGIDAVKTAITGAGSGQLVVSDESLLVEGATFATLLGEEVTSLTGNLTSLNGTMDTLCDEIIVELAS